MKNVIIISTLHTSLCLFHIQGKSGKMGGTTIPRWNDPPADKE